LAVFSCLGFVGLEVLAVFSYQGFVGLEVLANFHIFDDICFVLSIFVIQ